MFRRRNSGPREYIVNDIGEENIDEFERWAFGEEFDPNDSIKKIPTMWNRLHPDCIIDANDRITPSCDKMIDAWKEYKK